jgi:hypothetical protein
VVRWWLALAAAFVAGFGFARPAAASSDGYGCEVHWRVESAWRDCGGLALLRPGNDSRLNLFLLIGDRRKGPPQGFGYPDSAEENRALGQVFAMWFDVRGEFFPVAEEDGWHPRYAYPPGSCERLAQVRAEFAAALAANTALPDNERRQLGVARLQLEVGCADPPQYSWNRPEPKLNDSPVWPEGIASPAGQAFLAYLKAAHAFYANDMATARRQFAELGQAPDPWVAETSRYMAVRIELDDAWEDQANEYGYRSNGALKPGALARVDKAIAAYQSAYPKGRYSAAAEGSKRQVYALRRDWRGLAGALSVQIDSGQPDGMATSRLVEEIDTWLMGRDAQAAGALSDPLLLAVWDLKRMRIAPQEDKNNPDYLYYLADDPYHGEPPPPFSRKDLQAQASTFAGYDELYAFLDATFAYYHERDYRRVLALIPPGTKAKAYTALELGRQALRAMALSKLDDPGAIGQWASLLDGASAPYQRQSIELGLASSLEQAARINEVFAAGSPVRDTTLRTRLLQFGADRKTLRRAAADRSRPARERDMAAFALLYKDLSYGRYANFAADRTLVRQGAVSEPWFYNLATREQVPAGLFVRGSYARGRFACPDLGVTARQLAAKPDNPHALLCLGEFWRIAGFDRYLGDNVQPRRDELAGTKPQFPGTPLERGDIYLKVLADPATAPADRAYALYRASWCYASSGRNTCGGKEVDQAQRRAWFAELKTRHAGSPWARKLEFYW